MSCWIWSACCSKAGRLAPAVEHVARLGAVKLRDIEAQTVGPGRNRKVETGDALGLLVEQQKGPEGHRKNGAKEHEHAGKAEAQAPANRQVAHEPSHTERITSPFL